MRIYGRVRILKMERMEDGCNKKKRKKKEERDGKRIEKENEMNEEWFGMW